MALIPTVQDLWPKTTIRATDTPEQAEEAFRDAQRQRIRKTLSENIRAIGVMGTMYDLESVRSKIELEISKRIGVGGVK